MTIDKNNIFLGATVKNDDAKVIISRIVAGGAVQIDGRLREGTYFFSFFLKILSLKRPLIFVRVKRYLCNKPDINIFDLFPAVEHSTYFKMTRKREFKKLKSDHICSILAFCPMHTYV